MVWSPEMLLAFAPGVAWLVYVWLKDRAEPEPHKLVLFVFVLGGISAFGVLAARPFLELHLVPAYPLMTRALMDSFVVTSCFEELFKISAFVLGVYWCKELDEPMDGIVYGAAAGLGFASVENAFFLMNTNNATVLLLRGFTATVLHGCLTAIIGFGLTVLRLRWGQGGVMLLAFGTAVFAVGIHGVYDLFLYFIPEWRVVALLGALPMSIAVLAWAARWSERVSPHRQENSGAAPMKGDSASLVGNDPARVGGALPLRKY